MTDTTNEEEIGQPPYISENGRITVNVGTTFTYGGQSHWPKVGVEDVPLVFIDDEGNPVMEGSDELIYRVTETVHYVLAAVIARMKRDIDARAEQDLKDRKAKQASSNNSAQ